MTSNGQQTTPYATKHLFIMIETKDYTLVHKTCTLKFL